MTAHVIEFPSRCTPVRVPAGAEPASVIILPIVRIERSPDIDPDEQLARRFGEARKRRRLRRRNLPKAFLSLVIA